MQEVSENQTPAMAPGCYASPSVFARDSEICRGCPTYEQCASACVDTLHALRDRINIDSLLARHRSARQSTIEAATPADEPSPLPNLHKFMPSVRLPEGKVERQAKAEPKALMDVSPEDQAIIDTLKVKSQALALTWVKKGMIEQIRQDLAEGRNPFGEEKTHPGVVCDLLLKGVVTKHAIRDAFMARLGNKKPWDKTTANAHVDMAMSVLVAFGIAIESPAGFVVNPEIKNDNV